MSKRPPSRGQYHGCACSNIITLKAMVTKKAMSISDVPTGQAIYALYGRGRKPSVAYVGLTNSLRNRMRQHLIHRDSTIAMGTSAVGINPDYIGLVAWWMHPLFEDEVALAAAELVAFDELDPDLRSRTREAKKARQLAENPGFRRKMTTLFSGKPTGRWILPTVSEVFEHVLKLEDRVASLEERLQGKTR